MTLKDLRNAAHLTQQQAADAAGLTIRYYQKIEAEQSKTKKLSLETALLLAKALSITPDELAKLE